MIRILIACLDKENFANLKAGMKEDDVQIRWTESCEEVLSKVKEENFDLILMGDELSHLKGLECIERLILSHPLLNCAAVSSLSAKDFHEATEGLGILMQLPVKPSRDDAKKLLGHLKHILNLTKRIS